MNLDQITEPNCRTCMEYFERRWTVLTHATAALARVRGFTPAQVGELSVRYVNAVHERHLAGLSLVVRKRTAAEVDAARETARLILEAQRTKLRAAFEEVAASYGRASA